MDKILKMKKFNYRKINCDKCGKKLDDPSDLIIWNEEDNEVSEISFRHGSGKGCDDKSYRKSYHTRDYDLVNQLIDDWKKSPFNEINKKYIQ